MIIDSQTSELTRTPRFRSEDNTTVEHHQLDYSTAGAGAVRVSVSYSPLASVAARAMYAGSPAKELRESWERYLQQIHQTKTLRKLDNTDPRDLSRPFVVQVEGTDSPRLNVTEGSFRADLVFSELLTELPALLRIPPTDDTSADSAADPNSPSSSRRPQKRRSTMWLPARFVKEQHYRIQPPAGFVIKEMPEAKSFSVAGAKFQQKISVEDSGVIAVDVRLDTGDGIFSAEQVEEFRSVLAEVTDAANSRDWIVPLQFEHRGLQHFAAGRFKDGLSEFRQYVSQFPGEAVRHLHLADALLTCGFGTLARERARRAVELEPKSARMRQGLHRVLTHDEFGRLFRPGFDWLGAQAAIDEAIRLDPAAHEHRWSLAILLEHDRDGQRYGVDAKLSEAADLCEKISRSMKG
ncbi:MAG TPA: hypothetical protein VK137_04020, partial [Planctomycetaceae bacterium]|nr:hypothetical protein [Planctomycetaceae bacterium]